MRYDFIREGMKGRCYKRENGKSGVFFLFINFIWDWGKKIRERKDKKMIIYITRIKPSLSILMIFFHMEYIFFNCQSLCNIVKILFDDRFLLKSY